MQVTHNLDMLDRWFVDLSKRASAVPRVRKLETSDRLAVIHQHGAKQTVTSERQRRAIYSKVGPGQKVPAVGTVMVHPARPVRATRRLAKEVALADVRYIRLGGAQQGEPLMRGSVREQFSAGGIPGWTQSSDWGNHRARNPTLGGPGGRVGTAWRAATYSARR